MSAKPTPSRILIFAAGGIVLQCAATCVLANIDVDARTAVSIGSVGFSGPLLATLSMFVFMAGANFAMPYPLSLVAFVFSALCGLLGAAALISISVHGVPLHLFLGLADRVEPVLIACPAILWISCNLFVFTVAVLDVLHQEKAA